MALRPPTVHSTRPEPNNIPFDGRLQIECPATYKPSPNMQTRDCLTLGQRSKHFFPLETIVTLQSHFASVKGQSQLPNLDRYAIGR